MSTALTVSLIILVFVIIAAIVAVTIYLVKFLMELCLLTKSLNETTEIVNKDLQPILTEFKDTMKSVNAITRNADTQVAALRKFVSAVIGFVSVFAGKFKFLSGSFMKGFLAAFNLFRKK